MHIFTLEAEERNFDNAEFVSAPEKSIEFEQHLESWLENNPWILVPGEDIFWIGKRTSARVEDMTIFPDLLGVDAEGNLIVVELKRGRTPRDTIAQLLDYAAWADEILDMEVREIAERYFEEQEELQKESFDDVFRSAFDMLETDEVPMLNRSLRLYIVAGRISERILKVCRFLRNSHSVNVSCIAVSMFETETGNAVIGMETELGDRNRLTQIPSQNKQEQDYALKWEVVWEKILQLTERNPNGEFITAEVRTAVLDEHPNFNKNTISGGIHSFRQLRYIVWEAIQQLGDRNTNIDFTAENIMQVILEDPPNFSQPRLDKMIDLFCQFGISKTGANQMKQGMEN